MRGDFRPQPFVVLVQVDISLEHFQGPSRDIRNHVAAGGRVVAFYNASPELSKLIGLAPPRYENDRPGWTAMAWNGRRIPHSTEHLLVPVVKDPAATRWRPRGA